MLLQQKRNNRIIIIFLFSIAIHAIFLITIQVNINKKVQKNEKYEEIEINLNDIGKVNEETQIYNPEIPELTSANNNDKLDIKRRIKINEKVEKLNISELTEIPDFIPSTYPEPKKAIQKAKSNGTTNILEAKQKGKSHKIGSNRHRQLKNTSTSPINSKKIILSYLAHINKIIKKNVKYPYIAKKNEIEGKVIVKFKILKNGKIENIKIIKSSGYKILDKSAIKAIRISSPLPQLPNALRKNNLIIEVPINFFLED